MSRFSLVRRLLAVGVLAVWWGGFTFYALAVIPSGHQVLHSRVRQGFITQLVTEKLNWLGVAALGVVLAETLAARPRVKRFRLFLGAWLVCVTTQAALFLIHARMDALLDATRLVILDEERFSSLHPLYLCAATTGWMAAGLMLALAASPPGPAAPPAQPKL